MKNEKRRSLTREERRRRQRLEANIKGTCVIGALVAIGFMLGRWR